MTHPIKKARPESLFCHGCRESLKPNEAVQAAPPSIVPVSGGRRRTYPYHRACSP